MMVESIKAMFQSRRAAATGGSRGKLHQHNWLHGLPFKVRFRRSKLYISALAAHWCRHCGRHPECHHGCWRRFRDGSGHDLFAGNAHIRGCRHLPVPDHFRDRETPPSSRLT